MRYRLATLLLFVVVPVMSVLAAPAPDPSAILDIGPPPKGKTAEEHGKSEIERLTFPYGILNDVWHDAEVRKLPSIAPLWKDAGPWLVKNIRITEEAKGRRLRLIFRAGNRSEQAAILDALLRAYIRVYKRRQKFHEDILRNMETGKPRLAKLLIEERDISNLKRYQKEWEDAKIREVELHTEIARIGQIAVIKWSK